MFGLSTMPRRGEARHECPAQECAAPPHPILACAGRGASRRSRRATPLQPAPAAPRFGRCEPRSTPATEVPTPSVGALHALDRLFLVACASLAPARQRRSLLDLSRCFPE